jgi:hypothetical protein
LVLPESAFFSRYRIFSFSNLPKLLGISPMTKRSAREKQVVVVRTGHYWWCPTLTGVAELVEAQRYELRHRAHDLGDGVDCELVVAEVQLTERVLLDEGAQHLPGNLA